MPITKEQQAAEYREMIQANAEHLRKALKHGDRVLAHGFVDAIIDNSRLLGDLTGELNGRILITIKVV